MRLIILAASMDDGLDWLDRFMSTNDAERTNAGRVGDVHAVKATIIEPSRYDRLERDLDPNELHWLSDAFRKVVRTDRWALDGRVERALHALNVRHPLCDPTGLLGVMSDVLEQRRGFAYTAATAPMGVKTKPRKSPMRPSRSLAMPL